MAANSLENAQATHRTYQMSASKVREVLDLIRGERVFVAMARLASIDRGAAEPVAKVLRSAAANAGSRYGIAPEELMVSRAFADEGSTLKRFRPRARGRAGRIRKRTAHITIEVQRLPEEELSKLREQARDSSQGRRARRVKSSRARTVAQPDASEVSGAVAEDVLAETPVSQDAPLVEVVEGGTVSDAEVSEELTVVETEGIGAADGGESGDAVESKEVEEEKN